MKNIIFTVLVLIGLLFNQYSFSQSNPRMQNPIYVQTKFFDDFKSSQLNRSVWNVASHSIVKDKYQTNLFIWVDSIATVNQSNDSLNLSMLYYQNYRTTDWNNNPIIANFIAGSLETLQTYSYGVYECKANFANQRGSFPAFWLMSKMPCSSSYNNEIDIVELKYEHDSPTLDNNIFYYPTNCNPNNYSPGIKENPFTWGQPHTFKCIWSPSKIEYWVDNTLLHTVQNTGQTEYPQLPQRIILSQQITMFNTTQPIYGIVTPQTSNFHWVKYREFFLAPEITCPSLICSSGTAVMDVAPSADSITWSLTPTNLFSDPKTGTGKNASITAASGASGQGKITFTFKMPTNEIFTAEKTFWVGKPNNAQIDMMVMFGQSPYDILCTNMEQTIAAGHPNIQQQGIDEFYWDFGSWAQYHIGYDLGGPAQNSRPTFYLYGYPPSSEVIKAAAHNQCGHDASMIYARSKTFYAQNCFGFFLSFSPNPSGDETALIIESDSKEVVFDELSEWELEIYDQTQTLKEKKSKIKGKEHQIQTAGWKEGVYLIRVKYKDEILQGKLVVKR